MRKMYGAILNEPLHDATAQPGNGATEAERATDAEVRMGSNVTEAVKACSDCEQVKPLADFPPDRRRKDSKATKCRPCARKVAEAYYQKYPEAEARRRLLNAQHGSDWYQRNRTAQILRMKWTRIATRYGMTRQEYLDLLSSQGGACALCGSKDPGRGDGHFAVDHNHATGRIRGLLCQRCNCGIGFFADDVELMRRAAAYVAERP
jgi:hypothetical protein